MDEECKRRAEEALSQALEKLMSSMRYGAGREAVAMYCEVIRSVAPIVMHEPQFANLQKQILGAISGAE